LRQIQERLGGSPWAVYRFLRQPHPALNGMTGLQALEHRKIEEAIAAAEGIGQGDFT